MFQVVRSIPRRISNKKYYGSLFVPSEMAPLSIESFQRQGSGHGWRDLGSVGVRMGNRYTSRNIHVPNYRQAKGRREVETIAR